MCVRKLIFKITKNSLIVPYINIKKGLSSYRNKSRFSSLSLHSHMFTPHVVHFPASHSPKCGKQIGLSPQIKVLGERERMERQECGNQWDKECE